MSLADYVNVVISATGPGPSAPGFGVGLIAAYHTLGGTRRVMGPYSNLAGVVADGFTSGTANTVKVYNAASKYFAQNPAPSLLYIGRRAQAFTQIVDITPQSVVNGTVYTFNVGAVAGVGGSALTYTVSGSPTLAALCTTLATLLGTVGVTYGYTADGSSGTKVRVTQGTPGKLTEFQVQVPASVCKFKEMTGQVDGTLAAGLTADLTAIRAENKQWYGFGLDSNSDVEVEAAAAWAESDGTVIFAASSSDSEVADPVITTDVASFLKTGGYTRTAILFNQYSNLSYGAFAWLASRLTQTPGSDTWNFNTLATVQADSDTLVPESSVLAVLAKNASVYTTLANLNLTQGGTSAHGDWMDQTRFIDWLKVTIQLAMVALIARNTGKIPYTDGGIAVLEQTLKSCLDQGVQAGGLIPGSYVVTAPLLSSIPSASKIARTLPSLPWTAKLAGAIHRMTINGTASAS